LGRIAFVTTWGQHCGISTYSEQLAHALASGGSELVVFAPAVDDGGVGLTQVSARDTSREQKIGYYPVWSRRSVNYSPIVEYARQMDVSLVHIQHEDGLFWDSELFLQLLKDLKNANIKSVVTLHTVRPSGGAEHTGFYRRLRERTSAVVCHTPHAQSSLLAAAGAPEPGVSPCSVVRIPHGTPKGRVGSPGEGLKVLNLPERRWRSRTWAICLGFVGPNKNIACTVRAVAEANARGMADVGFIIVGETGEGAETYMGQVQHLINQSGYRDRFLVCDTYVQADKVADVLSLAAFGILNSTSRVFSASGQVHLFAAHELPLAVADLPIYSDAVAAGAVPFRIDGNRMEYPTLDAINAVAALGESQNLRKQVRIMPTLFIDGRDLPGGPRLRPDLTNIDLNGTVYGPAEFVPGFEYEALFRTISRGDLLGAIGIHVPHYAITSFSEELRARAADVLKLIPQNKFFVWDELSVKWMLHYGIKAQLAEHPWWLAQASGLYSPAVGWEPEDLPLIVVNLRDAFRAALSGQEFCIHLPVSMKGSIEECHQDISTHVLYRWAVQYSCTDVVVTDEEVPDSPAVMSFHDDWIQARKAAARAALIRLRRETKTSVQVVDSILGVEEALPEDGPLRRLELGSVFEPAGHYDEHYYGVAGKGILYWTPSGWQTYQGTAHYWGGNKSIAKIADAVLGQVVAGKSILDVGCGAGDFLYRMQMLGWAVKGADISDDAHAHSNPVMRRYLEVADVTKGEVEGTYVVTSALDFWEHIFSVDLDVLIDGVADATEPGGYHFACICTRGAGEEDQDLCPGVKVTKENSWLLVSGHVHIRRWAWWLKKFREHGFKPAWHLMKLFDALMQEDPAMRDCASWGARNVLILQKG